MNVLIDVSLKYKTKKLTAVEIIIDQTAQDSLALIEQLQNIGIVQNHGDSIWTVTGATENAIFSVTDQFPQVIMKVETL